MAERFRFKIPGSMELTCLKSWSPFFWLHPPPPECSEDYHEWLDCASEFKRGDPCGEFPPLRWATIAYRNACRLESLNAENAAVPPRSYAWWRAKVLADAEVSWCCPGRFGRLDGIAPNIELTEKNCLVIELARRRDRLVAFREGYAATGLPRATHWPAIDAQIHTSSNPALCCRSAHANALRYLFRFGGGLICEGDCVFRHNFWELSSAMAPLLPPDWEAVWLGGQFRPPAEAKPDCQYWSRCTPANPPHRTHCYMIRGSAIVTAWAWLTFGPTNRAPRGDWLNWNHGECADHADWVMGRPLAAEHRVYYAWPPLAGQRAGSSEINPAIISQEDQYFDGR